MQNNMKIKLKEVDKRENWAPARDGMEKFAEASRSRSRSSSRIQKHA
jgi:hypothetical protein